MPTLSSLRRATNVAAIVALAIVAISLPPRPLRAQSSAPLLTIVARQPIRALPLATVGGQDFVALDDIAARFQATAREESGAITLTYQGRTIVLTPEQTMVSVAGRVLTLGAAPARVSGRWLVPIEFLTRAFAGIYDQRVELRRASRLLIVGDLRVPRVTIRHEAAGPGARIVIETTPRAATAVTRDGDAVRVRFEADGLDPAWPSAPLADVIAGYRQLDPTSISVDIGPRVATVRSSTQVSSAGLSTVIDLLPQADAPGSPQTSSAPASTSAASSGAGGTGAAGSASSAGAPPVSPTSAAAAVSASSSGPGGGDASGLAGRGRGVRTIVIDPGHGGDEPGVRGTRGSAEKDITLAVARRLESQLSARLGVRVLLTRADDATVAVTSRTALANTNKADLFISLHANASAQSALSGAVVYTATFAPGALGPQVLTPPQLPSAGGGMRDIELVPWNTAQARHRSRSEVLAALMVESLTGRIPLAATPLDEAPLRVLEAANMPAVLIEMGFLTNGDQEGQLGSEAFQNALAQAITDAVARFMRDESPSTGQ